MPARPPSDEEFSQLVHAVWPALFRTAYLLLGDHAEAEDLTQTALAKTYASWGKVRDIDAAPGYARTVLVNTANSWFRRRSWRNERPTEVLPDLERSPYDDGTERLTLMSALALLPPRQRAVVVLRFYDDLSVGDTARLLAVSEGTVKSQTSHALAHLRGALGDRVVPHLPTTFGAHHD